VPFGRIWESRVLVNGVEVPLGGGAHMGDAVDVVVTVWNMGGDLSPSGPIRITFTDWLGRTRTDEKLFQVDERYNFTYSFTMPSLGELGWGGEAWVSFSTFHDDEPDESGGASVPSLDFAAFLYLVLPANGFWSYPGDLEARGYIEIAGPGVAYTLDGVLVTAFYRNVDTGVGTWGQAPTGSFAPGWFTVTKALPAGRWEVWARSEQFTVLAPDGRVYTFGPLETKRVKGTVSVEPPPGPGGALPSLSLLGLAPVGVMGAVIALDQYQKRYIP